MLHVWRQTCFRKINDCADVLIIDVSIGLHVKMWHLYYRESWTMTTLLEKRSRAIVDFCLVVSSGLESQNTCLHPQPGLPPPSFQLCLKAAAVLISLSISHCQVFLSSHHFLYGLLCTYAIVFAWQSLLIVCPTYCIFFFSPVPLQASCRFPLAIYFVWIINLFNSVAASCVSENTLCLGIEKFKCSCIRNYSVTVAILWFTKFVRPPNWQLEGVAPTHWLWTCDNDVCLTEVNTVSETKTIQRTHGAVINGRWEEQGHR